MFRCPGLPLQYLDVHLSDVARTVAVDVLQDQAADRGHRDHAGIACLPEGYRPRPWELLARKTRRTSAYT